MSSKVKIILLVIIIFLLVTSGFFIFGYTFGSKFSEVDSKNEIKEIEKNIDLDINSGLVLNTYSLIPAYSSNMISLNAYQDKKVTIDDLDNKYLLGALYKALDDSLNTDNIEVLNGDFINDRLNSSFKFSSNLLDKYMLRSYGKILNYESFYIDKTKRLDYSEGYYTYINEGTSNEYGAIIRKIDKAYEDFEYMYIEDSFLYYTVIKNNDLYENHLYSESNMINEVEIKENYFSTDLTAGEVLDYIKEYYQDDMGHYKHIFKKNDDGSFYWVSSEKM